MDKSRSNLFLAILNLLGFLGVVIVNGLANALPINNKTTGELSDQYPNLFVPAGLTFSIWGVIYILLAIFVIHQLAATAKKDVRASSFTDKIGVLFFVAAAANMGWIFAWHYEILPLSMVIMLLLLACLITMYLRLRIGRAISTNAEKFLIFLPFSIYLGWITIATIANATAWLVDVNWNAFGLGEQFWAVAMIAVGIAIAITMLFERKDIFYGLVVDWALLGILIKRLAVETTPDQSVVVAAIVGLVLVSAGIIIQIVRRKVY